MNAESAIETPPRWHDRLTLHGRRETLIRFAEIASAIALAAMLAVSYAVLSRETAPGDLLTPPLVALLLVANLVPAMALMVLVARRFAQRRAAESEIGGRGRLHTRLVALFSGIAALPTVLVVIFASLLFQSGLQFWFSDRARGMIENAASIAQQAYNEELERVGRETATMSGDVGRELRQIPIDSPEFSYDLFSQVYIRNLSEALILKITNEHGIQSLALVNPYDRPLEKAVTPDMIKSLRAGNEVFVRATGDRIEAITPLDYGDNTYIYAARVWDPKMTAQVRRANSVLNDYHALLGRARSLQFRFNAALLVVSLLIVALSIWIALKIADRLVRPVGALVGAARRVSAGDLTTRVPVSEQRDEIATLGDAFNQMTHRLEEQTGALVSANKQIDNRRAFIEAVLSGVSAGVISVDQNREIRLINSSAEAILKAEHNSAVGRKLVDLAPELDRQLDSEEREDIIQFASGGEPRTLAVRRVKVEGGYVLTFDDITQQIIDQRRAAWSDVARRIAHEIKNPLTPIQLAAERLQRRYGEEIESDRSTFERLTGTIVRQVGDLRRMVDEFSSFARMPKPVFRPEPIVEIARQALFLHEVAHPEIRFALDAPEPSPILVCDRRQIGQALTNIVKNGVEAIQQRREEGDTGEQSIAMSISQGEGQLCIDVTDSGIGLPADREHLTEPYMTTRAKGTGLGLAIVKKIVEEHFGSIAFEDTPGGGTRVRLVFDAEALSRLAEGNQSQDHAVNS